MTGCAVLLLIAAFITGMLGRSPTGDLPRGRPDPRRAGRRGWSVPPVRPLRPGTVPPPMRAPGIALLALWITTGCDGGSPTATTPAPPPATPPPSPPAPVFTSPPNSYELQYSELRTDWGRYVAHRGSTAPTRSPTETSTGTATRMSSWPRASIPPTPSPSRCISTKATAGFGVRKRFSSATLRQSSWQKGDSGRLRWRRAARHLRCRPWV